MNHDDSRPTASRRVRMRLAFPPASASLFQAGVSAAAAVVIFADVSAASSERRKAANEHRK